MLIDYLASKNIHTSVHFKPLHKYNVVKSKNQREYPVADVEWKKLISLPCHPGMNDEDIDYVMYWVREYFAEMKHTYVTDDYLIHHGAIVEERK